MRRLYTSLVAVAATLVPVLALAENPNQQMAEQIAAHLRQSGQLSHYSIAVKFKDGTVWLQGQVRDLRQENIALNLALEPEGVQRVVNNLSIAPVALPAPVPTPRPDPRQAGVQLRACSGCEAGGRGCDAARLRSSRNRSSRGEGERYPDARPAAEADVRVFGHVSAPSHRLRKTDYVPPAGGRKQARRRACDGCDTGGQEAQAARIASSRACPRASRFRSRCTQRQP